MTALDNADELELLPAPDCDAVMFVLDIALACNADRYAVHTTEPVWGHWGRANLLVDPDGTVRYA